MSAAKQELASLNEELARELEQEDQAAASKAPKPLTRLLDAYDESAIGIKSQKSARGDAPVTARARALWVHSSPPPLSETAASPARGRAASRGGDAERATQQPATAPAPARQPDKPAAAPVPAPNLFSAGTSTPAAAASLFNFGAPTAPAPATGAPSTTPLFAFGSVTSVAAAPAASTGAAGAAPASGFGSLFGASSGPSALFGAVPAAPPLFGAPPAGGNMFAFPSTVGAAPAGGAGAADAGEGEEEDEPLRPPSPSYEDEADAAGDVLLQPMKVKLFVKAPGGEWTDKGTGKVTVLKAKTAGADGKRPAKLVIRSDTGRITFNARLYSGLKVELKASKQGGPQNNVVTSLLNSVAAESTLMLTMFRTASGEKAEEMKAAINAALADA